MTITTKDFTGGEIAGSGLFDELMRTVNSHLNNEFKSGRIDGADYGQVYLGALTGAMQNASQFVLSKERTNKEIELMTAQILQTEKQNELIDLQKAKITLENQVTQYTLDNLLPQQLVQALAQTLQTEAQTALIQEQTSTQQKQQLQITAQISLVEKQEDLVDEQILTATFQYTDPVAGLLFAQLTKTNKEIEVLNQKKVTEEAQTVGSEATVNGLVGKEMSLKQRQSDSFLRDAEQKGSKIFSDIFQIIHSITPDAAVGSNSDPDTWGLTSARGTTILSELTDGITSP